jgi:hypothetical protein
MIPKQFELLRRIAARPDAYLRFAATDRLSQLENIGDLLDGFAAALEVLEMEGTRFQSDFGAFVYRQTGWSASCGAVHAIRQHAGSPDEAWAMFWLLAGLYRQGFAESIL